MEWPVAFLIVLTDLALALTLLLEKGLMLVKQSTLNKMLYYNAETRRR